MNEEELLEYFRAQLRQDPDVASAVAAIRTLLEFLKRDEGETLLGLRENLKWATDRLASVDSSVAVSSGGELFLRFISLTWLEHQELSCCKKVMEERGQLFMDKISMSRGKVAKLCHTFIKDGAKILTHSYSRVVLRVLEKAAAEKKRFSVFVTESQPDGAGRLMAEHLRKLYVPVTVILDAAVGYVLEKVDQVIVGAEGVVESGGIINKVSLLVCLFVCLFACLQNSSPPAGTDRHLPDGGVRQSPQQALLRGGRELQVRAPLPAQPAGRARQVQVQGGHVEDSLQPVGGAPPGGLHAALAHHAALHRSRRSHAVRSQR
ncbi:translation initiation factor eIF-2B subunit alpha isoform X1 [Phyllopteryx taeniolatus]|uniref:translation initiation factor eIF-2B subunit alpha isoform X1 n=1 Tax=Phyllopteryx taeniolatus TaxID=161469 RepID=UPI002AD22266|nr:translation initiation factor eIF-2B subunit alpha isoform X1 [Phyllopteryx taeniolatus]